MAKSTVPGSDPSRDPQSQGDSAKLPAQIDPPTVIHNYDLRGTDLSKSNNAFGSSDFSQTSTTRSADVRHEPLEALAEFVVGGDLPVIASLNPYRLGATVSAFGNAQNYGRRDPYVPRLHNDVDQRLLDALDGNELVLVAGPSKAGKTRTCFEAILRQSPHARLLAPLPGMFARLVEHPRLKKSEDAVVVWLDDLDRFVTHSDSLTPALFSRLVDRPGRTVVVATLRSEARARLREASGELTRDTRLLLEQSRTIQLTSTSSDPSEQALASTFYPHQDISHGLGADLAGAPALQEQHDDALYSDPVQHAVVDAVIDWSRAGRNDPIPERVLIRSAIETLTTKRFDLDLDDEQTREATRRARTPLLGSGRVSALITHQLRDGERGYRPFDYLVSTADGQDRAPRPIPDPIWAWVLDDADDHTAVGVGIAADLRGNTTAAVRAFTQAAASGRPDALRALAHLLRTRATELNWTEWSAASSGLPSLGSRIAIPKDEQATVRAALGSGETLNGRIEWQIISLGLLFAQNWSPGELPAALTWFEQKALSGDFGAMTALGFLLAKRCMPPDLAGARRWYEAAAELGDALAMYSLSNLLTQIDPPEHAEAELWETRARNTPIRRLIGRAKPERSAPVNERLQSDQ